MTDVQRNALARTITARLLSASFDDLRVIDRLVVRLEQLRALSWTRRLATTERDVDRVFHLPAIASTGRFATRCNGNWPVEDKVETSLDGPPLSEMCGECALRWARGRDVQLYGLLELARDLWQEDLARAELHELARIEMFDLGGEGGGA